MGRHHIHTPPRPHPVWPWRREHRRSACGATHVARAGAARAGARLARQVAVDAGHQEAQVGVKPRDLARDGRRAGVRAGRARGRAGRQPLVRAQLRGGRQLRRLRKAPGDLRAGLASESGPQASRGAGPGCGHQLRRLREPPGDLRMQRPGRPGLRLRTAGHQAHAGGQEPYSKQLPTARRRDDSMYRHAD